MKRACAALLGTALLASCTAGPDYRLPRQAMSRSAAANGAFVSGDDKAFAQAPLPDHWWRLYNDTRLDGYVQEALTANTDLRAADANLRRASAVVREVEAGRTVQTRIEAGAYAARVGGYTLTVPLDLPYSAAAGVGVTYPLDLAGGIRRGIEAAQGNREAVEAARDEVRVTVAAAVTRSYAAVCSANVTLTATRHVLDIQTQTQSSVQRLFKGGRGTAFDVTRSRTAADQSAAALIEIVAARQGALFELAALMGRAAADYPRELADCAGPPKLLRPLPIGDGTALIRRRPDIRVSERQLAAATAGIGVEMSRLYPQIALTGSAGLANSISGFFTGPSFGGLAGPMITWAFPNRKLIHARIAGAGASADAASAHFDGTVIEALRQTETALDDYAHGIEHEAALAKTRDDAAKSSDQAGRLFHYGRTDILNVLTAQANLAQAEAALAQARATLIDRQVNVFMALGGGWE